MDRYPEQIVSFHAVTRYVQRFLNIEAEPGPDALTTAAKHCAAAGLSIAAVQGLILTPGVALAIDWGMPQVSTGGMTVHIAQPSGVVTTVIRTRDTPPLSFAGSATDRHEPKIERSLNHDLARGSPRHD